MPLHHLFYVATRYSGNLALAVAAEDPIKTKRTAYLFDLKSKAQVVRFAVRHDLAGEVALSKDDRFGFVGCFEVYGLAAYCLKTGEEAWRRKDLRALGRVSVSEVQDLVYCGSEHGPVHLVEAETGKTLDKLRGVRGVFPSQFDDSVIVAGRALELHAPFGRKLATFKRINNYALPCAFSRSEFVLNEPDCLRCYDLKTSEPLWSYPIPGENVLRICFCESMNAFVAKKTNTLLLIFDARTGAGPREVLLSASTGMNYCFCRRGAEILAGNLQLLSTETGALLADLATPELIAWDPEARMDRFRELAASGRSPPELERYMTSEGFAKNDIARVLMMKDSNDRKKT